MKILQINKFLYFKGGDATVTLKTGELLRAHGHEVFFWGMKSAKNPSYQYDDLFVDEIDLSSDSGIKRQLKAAGTILYSFEAKIKIEKLIRCIGKPDIVHLHNFAHQISPSILHVFNKYKIPVVMTMHDYKLVCASYTLLSQGHICEKCAGGMYIHCLYQRCVKDSRAKSLLNTFEMYLHHNILHIYDFVDVFISPSNFLKNKVYEMGLKKPIEVLQNFVDISNFIPQYRAQDKVVCYFGRLSDDKGLITLLEAMKDLQDIKLKIIGDGPIGESLRLKVKNQKLDNIKFLGYKSGDDLKNEVRNSMFVIIPSECYENYPCSVIEAFALGKPVLGTNIGGIPELVRDGVTGMTFASGNAADLADKIKKLVADPELINIMGKRCRQWVEMELNAKQYYEQLMGIYQQVIGG